MSQARNIIGFAATYREEVVSVGKHAREAADTYRLPGYYVDEMWAALLECKDVGPNLLGRSSIGGITVVTDKVTIVSFLIFWYCRFHFADTA